VNGKKVFYFYSKYVFDCAKVLVLAKKLGQYCEEIACGDYLKEGGVMHASGPIQGHK
jgi:hypothetical protein